MENLVNINTNEFGIKALNYVDKLSEREMQEMAKAMKNTIHVIRNMLDYINNKNLADLANKKIFEHLVKLDDIVKRTGGVYTDEKTGEIAKKVLSSLIRDLGIHGSISSLVWYSDYKEKERQSMEDGQSRRMRM